MPHLFFGGLENGGDILLTSRCKDMKQWINIIVKDLHAEFSAKKVKTTVVHPGAYRIQVKAKTGGGFTMISVIVLDCLERLGMRLLSTYVAQYRATGIFSTPKKS